ncbi:hypothetical protein GCM10020358_14100 [Amorphoplanes nipponensis]
MLRAISVIELPISSAPAATVAMLVLISSDALDTACARPAERAADAFIRPATPVRSSDAVARVVTLVPMSRRAAVSRSRAVLSASPIRPTSSRPRTCRRWSSRPSASASSTLTVWPSGRAMARLTTTAMTRAKATAPVISDRMRMRAVVALLRAAAIWRWAALSSMPARLFSATVILLVSGSM